MSSSRYTISSAALAVAAWVLALVGAPNALQSVLIAVGVLAALVAILAFPPISQRIPWPFFWVGFGRGERQKAWRASYPNYIKGETILLAALARNNRIRDVTFEDCLILGPGVLYVLAATSYYNPRVEVEGDIDTVLIEIKANQHKIGFLGLDSCIFRNCRFRGIGFAGTPEDLERIKNSSSPGRP